MKNVWTGLLTLGSLLLALAAAPGALAQQPGRPAPPPPPPVMPAHGGELPNGRQASWPSGPERMSPEERRQLRRDINDHGREIYRERRERR